MLTDEWEEAEARRERRIEWWSNAARYLWRVLVNFFYIVVVFYVFSRLQERFETVVVALLGIIYTTLRSVGTGLSMIFGQLGLGLDKEFDAIKRLIDPDRPSNDAAYAILARRNKSSSVRTYIDIFGLAAISLFCLWQLFSVL